MFNFEKLEVWRKSVDFADFVYRLTQAFPAEERFGITNQMRRASVSISSNIAEGTSRSSKLDYSLSRMLGGLKSYLGKDSMADLPTLNSQL
jgi:four helix bundle protein